MPTYNGRIPFRQMRQTITLTIAECGLLLGVESIKWADSDYGLFYVMSEMVKKTENPTYPQMIGAVGAWLRFYKRLIEALPVDYNLRLQAQAEWDKLSKGYEELVS